MAVGCFGVSSAGSRIALLGDFSSSLVERFNAELGIEAFTATVLPRRASCDAGCLGPDKRYLSTFAPRNFKGFKEPAYVVAT